jgi:hypothetical protein
MFVAIIFLCGGCICFTHILQQYIPNVLVVFSLMLQQVVSCCNLCYYFDVSCVLHTYCKYMFLMFHMFSFLCCILLQVFYIVRPRWGRARPQPLIPALKSRLRGESKRDEGVRRWIGGYRDGGEVHSWSGAKTDKTGCAGVRTLATSIQHPCFCSQVSTSPRV